MAWTAISFYAFTSCDCIRQWQEGRYLQTCKCSSSHALLEPVLLLPRVRKVGTERGLPEDGCVGCHNNSKGDEQDALRVSRHLLPHAVACLPLL